MLRKSLESFLTTYMTIIKSVKMSYSKFVQYILDYESFTEIQRFINQLLIICLNLNHLLSAINPPGYNLAKLLIPINE